MRFCTIGGLRPCGTEITYKELQMVKDRGVSKAE